jgi:hypothetical protein
MNPRFMSRRAKSCQDHAHIMNLETWDPWDLQLSVFCFWSTLQLAVIALAKYTFFTYLCRLLPVRG